MLGQLIKDYKDYKIWKYSSGYTIEQSNGVRITTVGKLEKAIKIVDRLTKGV